MESDVAELPLSERLWTWFAANKQTAVFLGVVLAVMGLLIWFFIWRHDQQEIGAGEALSNVSLAQSTGRGSHPDLAEGYLKVAAQFPKSSAGARALLLAAGSLFVQDKFDEAKIQFEKFIRQHPDSPFVVSAILGIAASLDAQGKTNEAVTAYHNLIEHHPNDAATFQARFALGRLYEAQNKPEQARAYFEEIARSLPGSTLANESLMRLEEMRTKYPNLFATPSSARPLGASPFTLTPPPLSSNVVVSTNPVPTNAAPSNAVPLKLEEH